VGSGHLRSDRVNFQLKALRGALGHFAIADDSAHLADAVDRDIRTAMPDSMRSTFDEDNILGQLAVASDRSVIDFFDWHLDRFDGLQRALNAAKPEIEDYTRSALAELLEEGFVGGAFVKHIELGLARSGPLRAIDAFQARIMRVYGYVTEDGAVHIANLFDDDIAMKGVGRLLKHVVPHEWAHSAGATAGTWFITDNDHLLEEVAATHFSALLEDPADSSPNVLDPMDRRSSWPARDMYTERRQFASLLFEKAEILPQELLYAYSQAPGSVERRYLTERLDGVARDVFDGLATWGEVTAFYDGVPNGKKEDLLVQWADELFISMGGTVVRCDAEPGNGPFFELVAM
jgi:hypothetical protein